MCSYRPAPRHAFLTPSQYVFSVCMSPPCSYPSVCMCMSLVATCVGCSVYVLLRVYVSSMCMSPLCVCSLVRMSNWVYFYHVYNLSCVCLHHLYTLRLVCQTLPRVYCTRSMITSQTSNKLAELVPRLPRGVNVAKKGVLLADPFML